MLLRSSGRDYAYKLVTTLSFPFALVRRGLSRLSDLSYQVGSPAVRHKYRATEPAARRTVANLNDLSGII